MILQQFSRSTLTKNLTRVAPVPQYIKNVISVKAGAKKHPDAHADAN
jgi:hypothetical protein